MDEIKDIERYQHKITQLISNYKSLSKNIDIITTHKKLSPTQKMILMYLMNTRKSYTAKELATIFEVSERTIHNNIKEIEKYNYIDYDIGQNGIKLYKVRTKKNDDMK